LSNTVGDRPVAEPEVVVVVPTVVEEILPAVWSAERVSSTRGDTLFASTFDFELDLASFIDFRLAPEAAPVVDELDVLIVLTVVDALSDLSSLVD
jgi:hypothetical protein